MEKKRVQFICPHCQARLTVPEKYLGMRGKCNKCGGRIALIGRAEITTPQMASVVTDVVAEPEAGKDRPASAKQRQYLECLGVPKETLENLSLRRASELIDYYREKARENDTPTAKQLAYLERLGAPKELVASAKTKAQASDLIEAMHLLPTREQIDMLKELGASGAQLAALKRRAQADALIAELQSS